MKAQLIVFFASAILGIFLIIVAVKSEVYPLILMGALCFIACIIALLNYSRLKNEEEKVYEKNSDSNNNFVKIKNIAYPQTNKNDLSVFFNKIKQATSSEENLKTFLDSEFYIVPAKPITKDSKKNIILQYELFAIVYNAIFITANLNENQEKNIYWKSKYSLFDLSVFSFFNQRLMLMRYKDTAFIEWFDFIYLHQLKTTLSKHVHLSDDSFEKMFLSRIDKYEKNLNLEKNIDSFINFLLTPSTDNPYNEPIILHDINKNLDYDISVSVFVPHLLESCKLQIERIYNSYTSD